MIDLNVPVTVYKPTLKEKEIEYLSKRNVDDNHRFDHLLKTLKKLNSGIDLSTGKIVANDLKIDGSIRLRGSLEGYDYSTSYISQRQN